MRSVTFVTLFIICYVCSYFSQSISVSKRVGDPYPNLRNSTMFVQEMKVIETSKQRTSLKIAQAKSITKKPLLCATFCNGANALSMRMLLVNLKKMADNCDWAIVMYAGDPASVEFCRESSVYHQYIIHCKVAPIAKELHGLDNAVANKTIVTGPAKRSLRHAIPVANGNTTIPSKPHASPQQVKKSKVTLKTIPKPVLYMELLPYLPQYESVLLVDEDVSLFKFNFNITSAIWNCAFYPQPRPLIAQVLVSEGTQYFDYVFFNSWKSGVKNTIYAAETVFIEQQAPLFDSVFFGWFLENVVKPTLPKAIETGSDWGTDIIWCSAAYMYAKHILNVSNIESYVPCALLTKASPIVHRDGKTIQEKKFHYNKFNNRGFEMVDFYRSLYPTWIISPSETYNNPSLLTNTQFVRSYGIDKECYPYPLKIL